MTDAGWDDVPTVAGRGKRVARVVVEIYEDGDLAPYVLFDDDDPSVERATSFVARAKDALAAWS